MNNKKKKFGIIIAIIISMFIIFPAILGTQNEDPPTPPQRMWEDDFTDCGFKIEDKEILLNYIPNMSSSCLSIEKIAAAAFKVNMNDNKSYYITLFMAGEDAGHIACIMTTEEKYSDRTKLYPINEPEPENVYKKIKLDDICTPWFLTDDPNTIADEYENTYIEFDMSYYGYDWVKSIVDEYTFTSILTVSMQGNTPISYNYIQIKFHSSNDVNAILNANLGLDEIVVRGKIKTFNKEGILIEGIEIVKIVSYE